jgi:exosortase H (IPTLxxWG-CTERM-specific)
VPVRLLPTDPWLRFALSFALLAIGFELLYYGVALESPLFETYLETLAHVSAWILGWWTEVHVQGTQVTTGLFAFEIGRGCDAYRICALLGAGILAFPAPVRAKLWGLALGLVWLNALNLLRIVALFWIGGLARNHFEAAHELYLPVFLIAMTLAAWLYWVRRASLAGVEAPAA